MRNGVSLWLFVISLSGCATRQLNPPDIPVCKNITQQVKVVPFTLNGSSDYHGANTEDIQVVPSPSCMEHINEPSCGVCIFTVSGREVWVGEKTKLFGKTWQELKRQSLLLPAVESYAPLNVFITNLCIQNNCEIK